MGGVSLPLPMPKAWRFSLALPMLPDGATEAASRPGERLAVIEEEQNFLFTQSLKQTVRYSVIAS